MKIKDLFFDILNRRNKILSNNTGILDIEHIEEKKNIRLILRAIEDRINNGNIFTIKDYIESNINLKDFVNLPIEKYYLNTLLLWEDSIIFENILFSAYIEDIGASRISTPLYLFSSGTNINELLEDTIRVIKLYCSLLKFYGTGCSIGRIYMDGIYRHNSEILHSMIFKFNTKDISDEVIEYFQVLQMFNALFEYWTFNRNIGNEGYFINKITNPLYYDETYIFVRFPYWVLYNIRSLRLYFDFIDSFLRADIERLLDIANKLLNELRNSYIRYSATVYISGYIATEDLDIEKFKYFEASKYLKDIRIFNAKQFIVFNHFIKANLEDIYSFHYKTTLGKFECSNEDKVFKCYLPLAFYKIDHLLMAIEDFLFPFTIVYEAIKDKVLGYVI